MSRPSSAAHGGQVADDLCAKEGQTGCRSTNVDAPRWSRFLVSYGGVGREAWDGWATIHEKPHRVFIVSNSANVSGALINIIIMSALSRPIRWGHHLPFSVVAVTNACIAAMVWRHGPCVTKNRNYIALGSIAAILQCILVIRLLLGPIQLVPFGNRLAFAAANCVALFGTSVAAMLGTWASHNPPEPYKSFSGPILRALLNMLRLSDALTDMLVIRLMLERAKEPCFWFGARRSCKRWRIMAGVSGASAVIDLTASLFLFMAGEGAGGKEKQTVRSITCAFTAAFVCELSILTITMIKMLSDFEEPASSISPAERRNAIALSAVSFVITIASFTWTMAGTQRLVAAAARVTAGVRNRVSCTPAPSQGPKASQDV